MSLSACLQLTQLYCAKNVHGSKITMCKDKIVLITYKLRQYNLTHFAKKDNPPKDMSSNWNTFKDTFLQPANHPHHGAYYFRRN